MCHLCSFLWAPYPSPPCCLVRRRTQRGAGVPFSGLPESANKTCPPLGTTAHLVASLLAWPAWPPAVHAAAPPFGPILSIPSDCLTPAACFGARFFLCGLQAHPQGFGWNLSPWPHPTLLVAGPLVSALPILTSLPKANIWEGRAVKGCLRPQFTP